MFPLWKTELRTYADGSTEWYAMRRHWLLWCRDDYHADSLTDVLRHIKTETVTKRERKQWTP